MTQVYTMHEQSLFIYQHQEYRLPTIFL